MLPSGPRAGRVHDCVGTERGQFVILPSGGEEKTRGGGVTQQH